MLRPALDAVAAGIVFVLFTAVTTSAPVHACPFSAALATLDHAATTPTLKAVAQPGPPPIIEIATTSSPSDPNAVFRRTSHGAAWILLGLSFSLLVAFNLSIFRHLRHVYASPRGRRRVPK
jgi:hypothetical protein